MDVIFTGLYHAPNLHPMVVHYPIAFWVAATCSWFYGVLFRSDDVWRLGLWLQIAGAATAVNAVAFGLWATQAMGHDSPGHHLVHAHRDIMLVSTGLAVTMTGLAWWAPKSSQKQRLCLLIASIVLVGTMSVGADRGAELVFRYGVGVANEVQSESEHHHGAPKHHSVSPDRDRPEPARIDPEHGHRH